MSDIYLHFLDNKYTKWYFNIIENAQNRERPDCYTEKHHIIPRCMNGGNEETNLVILTAREHFIVHWLLIKMVEGQLQYILKFAFGAMCNKKKIRNLTPKQYAIIKKNRSEAMMGRPLSIEHRKNIGKGNKGKRHTLKTRKRLSQKHTGKILSESHKRNISKVTAGSNNPMYGRTHTEESKQKNRKSQKRRPKTQCPHCEKWLDKGNYNRWHGNKCKSILESSY